MKKIILFLAIAATVFACQKQILPLSTDQILPEDKDDVPAAARIPQQRKYDSLVKVCSNPANNARINDALVVEMFTSPGVSIEGIDGQGRRYVKYTIPVVFKANKSCYLPWRYRVLHGGGFSIPTAEADSFCIQAAFLSNSSLQYVDGYNGADVDGELVWNAYRINTTQIFGAYRVNGPQSETGLRANRPAKMDINIVLMEDKKNIPVKAVIGSYVARLVQLYAKENLTDDSSLWVPCIVNGFPETPYTVVQPPLGADFRDDE